MQAIGSISEEDTPIVCGRRSCRADGLHRPSQLRNAVVNERTTPSRESIRSVYIGVFDTTSASMVAWNSSSPEMLNALFIVVPVMFMLLGCWVVEELRAQAQVVPTRHFCRLAGDRSSYFD